MFSCYQPVPDGKYRLINFDGQTEYLSEQYFTITGQEFNSFTIKDGVRKDNGTKIIQYQSDNIFTFKRNDTVYGWKYSLNNDTLKLNSQNAEVYMVLVKDNE